MPRPAKTTKTVYFNVGIPEDLAARLKLDLYSPLEERIPHGKQSDFFTNLLRDHYAALDNATPPSGEPGVG